MAILKSHTIIEIFRGIKAFINLEAGLVPGEAPEPETAYRELRRTQAWLQERDERLKQMREWLEKKDRRIAELQNGSAATEGNAIKPENMIWMFGTGRAGTHWLGAMMGEPEGHEVWHEPMVGDLFGSLYNKRVGKIRRDDAHFILGSHRESWLDSIRSFVLASAGATFPELDGGYLVIREPNGSPGGPLLMEALPESRLIFLVRDPRDVMASWLDSEREGNWLKEILAQDPRQGDISADEDPNAVVERRARRYVLNVESSKQAYESHKGPKVLVKYEDLRADTLGTMKRIYSQLGMEADEDALARAVKKHSWESVPEEEKGEGKFKRKATPGGWREDLTPEQVRLVERITAPLLEEFYPG